MKSGASVPDRAATPTGPSPETVSGIAGIPCAEPRTWMKAPCGPCPYSRSKTLWLRPERAEDFAYQAQNPYTDFPCHKTADLHEDEEGYSEYVAGERSLTCNGFLSLQVNENGNGPDGFEPHPDAFSEVWEMIDHHTEHDEDEERELARAIEARRAGTTEIGPVHESASANGGLP